VCPYSSFANFSKHVETQIFSETHRNAHLFWRSEKFAFKQGEIGPMAICAHALPLIGFRARPAIAQFLARAAGAGDLKFRLRTKSGRRPSSSFAIGRPLES
jgi:hypothetical protein